MSAVWVFLRDFARRPNEMGAIAPTGRPLAMTVAAAADLAPERSIVELGAGTGAVTKVLRELAPTAPLLALEPGQDLARVLREACPDVDVSERLAHELPDIVGRWGRPEVDRVVSGLPWTLWPVDVQEEVLSAVVQAMKPDGRFVNYGYVQAQIMPSAAPFKRLLDKYFASVRKTKIVWNNLPPGFVWICDEPRKELGRGGPGLA